MIDLYKSWVVVQPRLSTGDRNAFAIGFKHYFASDYDEVTVTTKTTVTYEKINKAE